MILEGKARVLLHDYLFHFGAKHQRGSGVRPTRESEPDPLPCFFQPMKINVILGCLE